MSIKPPPLPDCELNRLEAVYSGHPYIQRLLAEVRELRLIAVDWARSVEAAVKRKLEFGGLPPEEMLQVAINDRVKAVEERDNLREQLEAAEQRVKLLEETLERSER